MHEHILTLCRAGVAGEGAFSTFGDPPSSSSSSDEEREVVGSGVRKHHVVFENMDEYGCWKDVRPNNWRNGGMEGLGREIQNRSRGKVRGRGSSRFDGKKRAKYDRFRWR